MFLKTKFKLPLDFGIHCKTLASELPEDYEWRDFDKKPNHLCTLNDAPFPDFVKNRITEIYKAVGVENPLMQKLVDPNALAFGGRVINGEWDLKNVNWELMIAYYECEAMSITFNSEALKKLQAKMYEKFGQLINHYQAYSDGKL